MMVSAVMIFLNASEFIAEAIQSVLDQTYSDWELLLVDDGSTDASSTQARAFADRFPDRIRYLEHHGHENRGMSASRNLGIRHARGRFIALLDADDVWLPGKLEAQVRILDDHPEAALVYDASLHWLTWTGDPEAAKGERLRKLGVAAEGLLRPPQLVTLFLEGVAETPGTCSVLIRREVVEAVGGFVEEFRGMFDDQAFFYKICLEYPVYLHTGYSALYRQHQNSCCHVAEKSGLYHPLGSSVSEQVFLEWLAVHLADRLKNGSESAGRLPPGVKSYLLRRRWVEAPPRRRPIRWLMKCRGWLRDQVLRGGTGPGGRLGRALSLALRDNPTRDAG